MTDVPDLLPIIYGNPDIKELILYALCRYDERNPRKTVPFVLIGKSGEGKSAILEAMAALYKSKIYTKNGITEASLEDLGMTRRALCIDELSKWSLDCLGAVLIVFSHSFTERGRKGKQSKIISNGLPVGTLLDTWEKTTEDYKGIESKKFIIAQLMRRAINLHVQPTTTDPAVHRQYTTSVVDNFFGLESPEDANIKTARMKIRKIIDQAVDLAQDYPDIIMEEKTAILEYIDSFRSRIVIDPLVSYDPEFPKLITNLAIGRAMVFGRAIVKLEDFKRVGDIITRHAVELGFWYGPKPEIPKT